MRFLEDTAPNLKPGEPGKFTPEKGTGRHNRRKMKALLRNRASGPKNTRGVPKGFSVWGWQEFCRTNNTKGKVDG